MKAKIVSFRRSRHVTSPNQMILSIDGVSSKESAQNLVGKKVVWRSPGKEPKVIHGKISAVHGSKGCVRAIFEKGMPGQALGTSVDVE